jgi:pentatricopeptide repeat protein
MYFKCGSVVDARRVFDQMVEWNDVFSWTVMIAAYAKHGFPEEALALFQPNATNRYPTQSVHLCHCSPSLPKSAALEQGIEVHEEIIRLDFRLMPLWRNALVDMYAKCGSIENARDVFDKMRQQMWFPGQLRGSPEAFSTNAIGRCEAKLKTFASILPACAHLAALEQGMEIHGEIIRSGFESDVFVGVPL